MVPIVNFEYKNIRWEPKPGLYAALQRLFYYADVKNQDIGYYLHTVDQNERKVILERVGRDLREVSVSPMPPA
ncbi:MAG: hypothetical protein V1887_02350 [Candidatus Aenigmatarchaeota archaeon]